MHRSRLTRRSHLRHRIEIAKRQPRRVAWPFEGRAEKLRPGEGRN
jgi:hypothetical protein